MDSACRKHQPPGSEDEGAFDRFRESERESSEQFGLLGQSKEREGSTLFNGDWIWAPSDCSSGSRAILQLLWDYRKSYPWVIFIKMGFLVNDSVQKGPLN